MGVIWALRGWPVEGVGKKDYIKTIFLLATSGNGFIIVHKETSETREWRYF